MTLKNCSSSTKLGKIDHISKHISHRNENHALAYPLKNWYIFIANEQPPPDAGIPSQILH